MSDLSNFFGRALGNKEYPGPVFQTPIQLFIFLGVCTSPLGTPVPNSKSPPCRRQLTAPHFTRCLAGLMTLMTVVYLVQCASGTTFHDLDGDGVDDVGDVARKEEKDKPK